MPRITVPTAIPGQSVKVAGEGFGSRTNVRILVAGTEVVYFTTGSGGTFARSIPGRPAGEYQVQAFSTRGCAAATWKVGSVAAPPPPPGPEPTPPIEDWQAAIDAAAPGASLDFSGTAFAKALTIAKPLTVILGDLDGKLLLGIGVTIRAADVTLRGGRIHDVDYAGVMVLSGVRVLIDGVTVERVAKDKYDAAMAGQIAYSPQSGMTGRDGKAWNFNAYGIALSAAGGPPTRDTIVRNCIVDGVPSWEGLDAHAGENNAFEGNTVRHCNRAIRTMDAFGQRAKNTRFDRNLMTDPTPRPDVKNTYPYNEVALTVYGTDGVTGTGNRALGWPNPLNVVDCSAVSVGVATS